MMEPIKQHLDEERLRGGYASLSETETAMQPDVHIFTRSKLLWVGLPENVPVFGVFYDVEKLWPADALKRRRAAIG